jgi:hypothetical protein
MSKRRKKNAQPLEILIFRKGESVNMVYSMKNEVMKSKQFWPELQDV